METLQLKITKEQDSTSMLFRQLFLLSDQLENHNMKHSQFKAEMNDVIQAIDELMEVILQSDNSLRS